VSVLPAILCIAAHQTITFVNHTLPNRNDAYKFVSVKNLRCPLVEIDSLLSLAVTAAKGGPSLQPLLEPMDGTYYQIHWRSCLSSPHTFSSQSGLANRVTVCYPPKPHPLPHDLQALSNHEPLTILQRNADSIKPNAQRATTKM